jgi:hypothetical protein
MDRIHAKCQIMVKLGLSDQFPVPVTLMPRPQHYVTLADPYQLLRLISSQDPLEIPEPSNTTYP